ncbi:hypothetical protein HPB52_004946 [Rhipicephalus sanguineus]|uniref:Uncharacterized protein n=1 Tax=Rhipicephalus sanguineus TaxID=34632 RepID=A0A9D4PBL0_RHISA|nr:hypothetical protein HPB52_004946 [Rhipicephalus sanguineus]
MALNEKPDSLDKEPLQRSDDADVSDVPGNPPSNSSDLRRDLAERDIARLSSALTTEQNSGVAVRQISDQSSKSADRRPSPVVESRASRAEEGSDRRTLHSSGRHDPSSKGFQRPPQRVCKTPLQGPPETSGRLELTGSLQNRPATNWRHPTSKRPATSTSSSESPNGDSVREQISPVQDQSVAAQSPAKEVRVNGPKTGSTGFPSPRGSSSPRGSDKGMPGVGDEGSSRASVASSSSSKRRSSPVPPRHNLSPERSSLSENGSEGSRMSTAGSTSPNRLVTPQLKQQHVFDPPWMKKRQRSDTRLLPFFFRSSPETSALLATSTWSRKSPFHAGELRNGGAQRGEPFGSLRSTSNLASSSTQGFLTEKEVGVKAFVRNQPTAVILLALLTLVVAGVVLLLLGVFGGGPDNRRRGSAAVCRTEPCRQYARRLVASMNPSLNPCEGFTRFVCDGWRRRNRLSVREEAFLSELRRMSYLLRSVPVPHKAQKPIQRAAAFYRSCDAVRHGDADELPKAPRRDIGGATVQSTGDTVKFADHVKLESTYMVPLSGAVYFPTRSDEPESIDLFALMPELSEERWITELDHYGGVSKPLVFRTRKPGYVTAFLDLWRERGERDMHLFYSWCVVQIAARYANRRLLINFYGCEDCADLYHGAFCLSKAYLLAGNQMFQEYFEGLFTERTVKSARRVVSDTLEAFARQIDAGPYRDVNHTAVHGSSANATNVTLRYFDPHFGSGKEKHAAVFNPGDMDNSLVENWQSIVLHLADVRRRWTASEQIEFVESTVLLPGHVLAVLPHALSFPSFDESATRFMNQAGLGHHIASALSEHFLQRFADSSDTSDPVLHSPECANNVSRFGDSTSASRLLGVLTSTLALEVSLGAYRAGGAMNSDEILEGFEGYSTTTMFFLASCYALCGGHDGVHHFTGEECDEPFRNASGFADAFACEPGSRMNPLYKCPG